MDVEIYILVGLSVAGLLCLLIAAGRSKSPLWQITFSCLGILVLAGMLLALSMWYNLGTTPVLIGAGVSATLGWLVSNHRNQQQGQISAAISQLENDIFNKDLSRARVSAVRFLNGIGNNEHTSTFEKIYAVRTNGASCDQAFSDIVDDIFLVLNHWEFVMMSVRHRLIHEEITYSMLRVRFGNDVRIFEAFLNFFRSRAYSEHKVAAYGAVAEYARRWLAISLPSFEEDNRRKPKKP